METVMTKEAVAVLSPGSGYWIYLTGVAAITDALALKTL
jgi:hypothetical protein